MIINIINLELLINQCGGHNLPVYYYFVSYWFKELVDVFTISPSYVINKLSKKVFIQIQLFQYSSFSNILLHLMLG